MPKTLVECNVIQLWVDVVSPMTEWEGVWRQLYYQQVYWLTERHNCNASEAIIAQSCEHYDLGRENGEPLKSVAEVLYHVANLLQQDEQLLLEMDGWRLLIVVSTDWEASANSSHLIDIFRRPVQLTELNSFPAKSE